MIGNSEKEKIIDIVDLHRKAFPSFFLTQLGTSFLKTLYLGYVEDSESGIIVAEKDGLLLGFIAFSKDYSGFFKRILRRYFLRFALSSMIAAIRHPQFIKRLLGAFSKSEEVEKKDRYVELASICVNPESEGQGIGTELVKYLISTIDLNYYKYISLETDAENNEKANGFYLKNGFILSRQYVTSEGRKMNEYRYMQVSNEL